MNHEWARMITNEQEQASTPALLFVSIREHSWFNSPSVPSVTPW
jgi:hypothetical protein